MKQLRIDFPDYPAKEQEKDIERSQCLKQIETYVMRVDGVWGAYIPRPRHSISITGNKGENLPEFIKGVTEKLDEFNIKPRFRCILNKGVEDFIKQQIIIQNLIKER